MFLRPRRTAAGKRLAAAARRQFIRRRFRQIRLEVLEDRRLLANVTWDGGGDGTTWGDRFNWSADTLPGASDDVVIDVPESATVRYTTGNTSVQSLVSQEALIISGGALTIGHSSAINGSFAIDAGSTLRVQAGSCFNSTLTVASGFTNQGLIELTNAGGCGTAATLNVASGTLTNAATGTISALAGDGGGRSLNAQLDNQGTINVGSGVTLPINGTFSNFNAGTLTGGTYLLAGILKFDGAAITTSAAQITLDGSG
ncbi:MAG TPA: hypothetical protein VKH44_11765, partial [Pirellulaceae bacterium]|nr:hypothetical protein [Pirellulaceae bacterium]